MPLIGGQRRTREMLDFRAAHNIVSGIAKIPLRKINDPGRPHSFLPGPGARAAVMPLAHGGNAHGGRSVPLDGESAVGRIH